MGASPPNPGSRLLTLAAPPATADAQPFVPTTKRASLRPRVREVEALVSALAATGAEITLVDRVRGHVYAGTNVLGRAPDPAPRPRRAPPPPTIAAEPAPTAKSEGP